MDIGSTTLMTVQGEVHGFCMVCSGSNPCGLALKFEPCEGGILKATFHAHPGLQGYEDVLHGGVAASLLDGVMTNRLFAEGIVAVTAELKLRYLQPVLVGPEIELRGWVEKRYRRLLFLRAELWQEGCLKVTASAKFMERYE